LRCLGGHQRKKPKQTKKIRFGFRIRQPIRQSQISNCEETNYAAGALSLTDAGAAGAAGAGAAGAGAEGAGAGGTAVPVVTEPASTVVPQELQAGAGAETMVVPQPHAGAGAGTSQPQAGAAGASHAGAGASQQGAGAGSQQDGAPLHLAARFSFSLASNPPPLQPASFLA